MAVLSAYKTTSDSPAHAVLLLSCPDRRGVVAAVAAFLAENDGNIVHAEQHVDAIEGIFFQRVEFDLDGFAIPRDEILHALAPVIERLHINAQLHFTDERPRVAVLASRQPHCLYDLLTRWRTGELNADLGVVIANHPDHAGICAHMEVPYVYLPVDPVDRDAQEAAVIAELQHHDIDLVVLARYMRILSGAVVSLYRNRMINIHHSFLPAFIGANPYRQAFERGVKLIGATAHYVTEELDEGPIIEQEVARVTHREGVTELTRRGRDLETIVLARAVRAHLEHRVLVYGRKTVVFN
ncbi:MAG: formyltetrahydrofolate deformylase [Ilumatobacteraceae bacterium]